MSRSITAAENTTSPLHKIVGADAVAVPAIRYEYMLFVVEKSEFTKTVTVGQRLQQAITSAARYPATTTMSCTPAASSASTCHASIGRSFTPTRHFGTLSVIGR